MNPIYAIDDTTKVLSPGLLFYKDIIEQNIAHVLKLAGDPARLRPHVKTHKTREIVRMQLKAGITKHKCATLAEAEMLASCGVPDVLIAYNLVGPNCARLANLMVKFPATQFCVLADHSRGLEMLSAAMRKAGQTVDVLVDLDVGQDRTGIAVGPPAAVLYAQIDRLPGLRCGGLHVYDGHNRQEKLEERKAAVKVQLEPVLKLRRELEATGLPVPRLVLGGTPTFPVHAHMQEPGVECSPGTFVLHDQGYGSRFPDLAGFTPAALVLTRVVSRPTPTRVTLDLGTKSIASDPPAGQRCILLNVPEYQPVIHNEEHFVIETPLAARFFPGDEVFAVPSHVCPTCALHKSANVVKGGKVCETWEIAARDRVLTV
ncbi:MAG TPA: D-TA family PLP-dependent enzyme [Gemmataceae bacterium]|nr:D-TA family PLP-dependent enzyme [Gemmataceae bacterium]